MACSTHRFSLWWHILNGCAALMFFLPLAVSANDTTSSMTLSSSCPSSSPANTTEWSRADILDLILSSDVEKTDPFLAQTVAELKRRGAHRCWHKHSSFLNHLTSVHQILKLWLPGSNGDVIARVGLLHSAYSNSYVNLALFNPNDFSERERVRDLIGVEAEKVVYLFCVIDRQTIVVDTLLKNGVIPAEGLDVPHIRDKTKTVHLDAEMLWLLVVFTMADISDQYFGWWEDLFGGSMQGFGGSSLKNDAGPDPNALWPGLSRPGLWVSHVSELGAVARSYNANSHTLPPVFDNCTRVLLLEHENEARNLYWQVITDTVSSDETIIEVLQQCIRLNPWVFEPRIMLAQKLLQANMFEEAQAEAERALELEELWGFPWDKRLGFEAWVAWTRVLHQRAEEKLPWPKSSWEVINFGLVK
eukprot:CAMPEP_0116049600 /NCGR_PEP_ID=MMETSP0321-20121206/30254_1 /TAXON_ID=163516 /ORGANISM="Leptocylindrus danicus var. danicus, Strain B650" /LENGTH=416 /DNA_ID=CAMNT_0003532043 /DNA_START=45 /DNA_END=1295 /DNA_ORIENTATION=+